MPLPSFIRAFVQSSSSSPFFSFVGLVAVASVSAGCTVEKVIVRQDVDPSAANPGPSGDGACPPGSMSSLDRSACLPVGPTASARPAGFAAAADGWGFHAVLPEAACSDATRAALGEAACVPVDDCESAAFPPAGAKVVHTALELQDAIQRARTGDVVAVESGTYRFDGTNSVSPHISVGLLTKVSVVGRCAREVRIVGDGTRSFISTTKGSLAIAGVSIQNFQTALFFGGSTALALDVKNVVFDGNVTGVTVDGRGSITGSVFDGARAPSSAERVAGVTTHGGTVVVEDSELRDVDASFIALERGKIDIRRSVVVAKGSPSQIAVFAAMTSGITLEDSVVVREVGQVLSAGLSTRDGDGLDASFVDVKRSEIVQRGAYYELGMSGAMGGSRVTYEESTLRHHTANAIMAAEVGSSASVTRSVIVTAESDVLAEMSGAVVRDGAELVVDGSAIVGARVSGLYASQKGTRLTVTDSLVAGTTTGAKNAVTGTGSGDGVMVSVDAAASFRGCVLADNDQSGLLVGAGGRVVMERSLVFGGKPDFDGSKAGHGAGITLFTDGQLYLHGSVIRKNADYGLVVMRSSAFVEGTTFEQNAGGVTAWESEIRQGSSGEQPGPREVVLVGNTFAETGPETQIATD